jgi:hypothetical protein
MMAKCGSCGAYLNDNDNFCEKCGLAVNDINVVINDLKKEKNSHEQVSRELKELRDKFAARNTEISKFKNELSARDQYLEDVENRYQQAAGHLKNEFNAVKKARNVIIVLWLLTFVLTAGIAWGVYLDLERRYSDLSFREDKLLHEYEWLLRNHNNSMQWWPVFINDIIIQNWDAKNKVWLSEPGQDIKASEMQYFNVKINFDSKIFSDLDFYIKLFDPYGRLFTTDNSPSDYSFLAKTYNIYRGNAQFRDLDGLPGTFVQGQWTVEVWISDVCIATETIMLK